MQHPFKEFFYFSRGERRGILVLIAGIILVFLIGYSYSHRDQPLSDEEIRQQALAEAEYEAFIATIQEEEKNTEKPYYRYPHEPQPAIELASFNPNTADSITFRSLGLPGWMARNILHYRAKGGKFRGRFQEDIRADGRTISSIITLYIHCSRGHGKADSPALYPIGRKRQYCKPPSCAL